jgi:hypothetical protein
LVVVEAVANVGDFVWLDDQDPVCIIEEQDASSEVGTAAGISTGVVVGWSWGNATLAACLGRELASVSRCIGVGVG